MTVRDAGPGAPTPTAPARFGALYSELELHRAVLRAYTKPLFFWKKALSRSHDGRTLYDFARRTPENVERLHQSLVRRRFHFREALPVRYNFNGRARTIYLFPWEERLVDLLLYRLLVRHFHGAFSSHSYAYRYRGFGVDACQRRIARALAAASRPVYFIKRDIADYFPSVDHALLLEGLGRWVDPGDYLFELCQELVWFRIRTDDGVTTAEQGIAFGSATACFFANLYLVPLDQALGALPALAYFRYADDLLAFSPDRDVLTEAAARYDTVLESLRLRSKPSHHRNFAFGLAHGSDPVFTSVTRFRHLGLEFREDGSIGLSRDKARKLRNLFRFALRRARRRLRRATDPEVRARRVIDVIRDVVENGVRSVAIIDYYLKHVDDERQLRLLDRWLAEEVLAWVFRHGHTKGSFRRLPFARLRALGLPSLRHRRRLLRHGCLGSSFFVLRTERLIKREGEAAARPSGAFSPSLEAAAHATPRERGGRLSIDVIEERRH